MRTRTCKICGGAGYTKHHMTMSRRCQCPHCQGEGLHSVPCRRCGGTGETREKGLTVGVCATCEGSGRFYPRYNAVKDSSGTVTQALEDLGPNYVVVNGRYLRVHLCDRCMGTGMIAEEVPDPTRKYKQRCPACKGRKEIPMFNPLPLAGIQLKK